MNPHTDIEQVGEDRSLSRLRSMRMAAERRWVQNG